MKSLGKAELNASAVEGYDGQLVHIIEGRLDRKYPLLLIDHESGETYDCPGLQNVLSGRALYERLPALKPPEKEKYPDRIRSLIYDGRLRLTTLLTSPGGQIGFLHSIKRMQEEVERREGDAAVFVGSDARSAAALLFANHNKQNRYCLQDTRFLWHAGTLQAHDPNDELSKEQHAVVQEVTRNMDLRAIEQFFSEEVSGEDSDEFVEYVRTTLREYGDVRFRGKDLRAFNVIERVSRSIEEMRDAFESVTGLPGYCVSRSYDKDRVHRFFTRAALEQCMKSVASRPIEYKKKRWIFEPQSEEQATAWNETMNSLEGVKQLDSILQPAKPFLPFPVRK